MDALYSVAEIVAATGGLARGVDAQHVNSISIDSRDIEPGALFVAIKGDRFDGHDFVAAAIANGAVAALVSEEYAPGFTSQPLIIVPDALEGLVDLARAARAHSKAKIIAVTGSVGKTSTKEAIRGVLERAGKTHASIKSFNNHWGVPLMLSRMPKNADYGVFEIGMNHAGEISPLSKLVQPHVVVITNVAPAHLDQLGSLEAIAEAKAEIFDGLVEGGTAVLNIDHAQAEILTTSARDASIRKIVTYGFDENADVRIDEARQTDNGMTARIVWPDTSVRVNIPSSGRHRLANATAALCVARVLNVGMQETVAALGMQKEIEGRGVVFKLGAPENPLTLVDESYNANPASMQATLEVFAGMRVQNGRKFLVLGDMLELGNKSLELHENLADAVLKCEADSIFLVGEQMAALAEKLGKTRISGHSLSVGGINTSILNSLDYGDVIMIKGSNGMRLGDLVSQIRDRFAAAGTTEQADKGAN